MPGPSGLAFLDRIRQDHREIVLVLTTAFGAAALEEGVRQLGVGLITKLFEPSSLVQWIEDLIRNDETTGSTGNVPRIMDKLGKPAGSFF
jgi:CheY-like chemotaxis protein